jgi:peptide/nickel transport system substrate-binding protein
MKRRAFLKAAAALSLSPLAAPRIAAAQGARVLRFVPQANLSGLDAVAGQGYVVRNAAFMVWETLYGIDSNLVPKPQMCEGHEASDDLKTWTFKLRHGLRFHDGELVTTRDVLASLKRWMVRDTMGQRINGSLDALEALDDRTFRFRLNKPFPKMLFALGKTGIPVCFIMPERVAQTDPFRLISEYIGSGPMKFRKDEWVPGSQAVFERYAEYAPRSEPADWLSGGRQMMFDRIEWKILPDAATAAAALQTGEVDWWENPIHDLVPLLKANRNVVVDVADPLGNIGVFRINHLHPPFNDVRARRAVMMAMSQEDYMQAIVGDDPSMWKSLPSFFTPGTPAYTEEGGDALKGPRNIDAARQLLSEAGLLGSKVTLLVATDIGTVKAQGEVSADLLKKLGFEVDYVATDFGTVLARRPKKEPPSAGGWSVFHTLLAGAEGASPASNPLLDAGGDKAWFGWPKSDDVQQRIQDWYAAPNAAAEKGTIAALNKASFDNVTYIPTGFFLAPQAWRKNISGVGKGPLPFFWGVSKAG